MRLLPRRRRARIIVAALALCGLSWLVYTAARTRVLLANGRAIAAQSANFPRDIYIGAPVAPALTYLAMGDSTGAGWGADTADSTYPHLVARALAKRGFRVRLVNVAVGGATVSDILSGQVSAIKQFAPDVITLSGGANDATHFTDLDAYRRDLSAITAALERSSARQVLVADTPDMWLAPALPLPLSWATARRARAQNAILDELARDSRIAIVPLYRDGKLDARVEAGLYAADWFHPSAKGYAKWAQLFIDRLQTIASPQQTTR